jgi:hypothetical protein
MLSNPDVQPNAAIKRWIAAILLFDFKLVHVPAEKHLGANGLSQREPIPGEDDDDGDPEESVDEVLSLSIWVDTWQQAQTRKVQACKAQALKATQQLAKLSTPTNSFVITHSKRRSNNSSSQHSDSPPSALSNNNTAADNNANTNNITNNITNTAVTNTNTNNITNTVTDTTTSPHSQSLAARDEELERIHTFLSNPTSLTSIPLTKCERFIKRA